MPRNHFKFGYNSIEARLRRLTKKHENRRLQPTAKCFLARVERRQWLQLIAGLRRENTLLRSQLRIDPMTGLFNRRALFEELDRQWQLWQRHGRVTSLLIIDLNNFKSINDSYGHAAGDRALITFARYLDQQVRASDWVARLGGDEFAILLPDTDALEAQHVATKLREDTLLFPLTEPSDPPQLRLDYAIGVATLSPCYSSAQQWIDAADQHMYRHKRSDAISLIYKLIAVTEQERGDMGY